MTGEAREHSFDELTRGLASGSISRGKALRLMGAALVGGALGSLGIGEAGADNLCKPEGKKCRHDAQCCSGNCSGGKCAACPSGQVLCNGNCVSNSCPTGQTFNTTTCQCECPSGQVLCNGNCVSNSCLANSGQVFNSSTCQCECPSGRVLLSNGTCAKPCTTITDCTGGFCVCLGSSVSTKNYCAIIVGSGTPGPCGTDADCPTGQFCRAFIEGNQCIRAC
jgi:Cys-rich repeat protein